MRKMEHDNIVDKDILFILAGIEWHFPKIN